MDLLVWVCIGLLFVAVLACVIGGIALMTHARGQTPTGRSTPGVYPGGFVGSDPGGGGGGFVGGGDFGGGGGCGGGGGDGGGGGGGAC